MIEHCHTMLDFCQSEFRFLQEKVTFCFDRNAVKWKINESYVNESL